MVRAERLRGDVAAGVACTAGAVGVGLLSDTALGLALAGPLAVLLVFLLFLWDIRLLVPLLIVALPLGPPLAMSFGNLYISTVLLMAGLFAWIARAVALPAGFRFRYNGVVLALLALVGSFVFSDVQRISHLLSEGPLLMKFIQFLLYSWILVVVYQMGLSRSAIRRLFMLMLAVGTLEACIGALQWIKGPAVYVIGTLGGHNVFSAYMTFIMLLMVGVTLETRRADVRLAGVAATAVMLYSIIFTFSRMAYISLLVSFLAFGLMPISRRKRIAIPAASVAITLVTLALVPVSVLERMRGILHTATGQQLALSFKFRLAMWRNALADFASSPIIGTGSSGAPLKDNFFAKAASEAGILGLGALLVLIYLILRASWRSIAEAPQDDFMRGIVVGFFPAAIGTLIVFNLAGDFITLNKFIGVFWIVLALIMRYRDAASTARPAS